MTINFDMDGTLANLYSVEGWLEDLRAYRVRPYLEAKPMMNFSLLARRLNALQRNGYAIKIISWGSKVADEAFDEAVAQAKRKWLAKHLPSVHFDETIIVHYGTPKHSLSDGILFDDEEQNRVAWGEGAYDAENILEILKNFL